MTEGWYPGALRQEMAAETKLTKRKKTTTIFQYIRNTYACIKMNCWRPDAKDAGDQQRPHRSNQKEAKSPTREADGTGQNEFTSEH
ncbi:hypothetical protein RB195_026281 [Necator americanus]|uniref:Uncharacterized protein n=1 Tax=Necator americanus TaxID=51031 RepID=A0ABR1EWR6_NECAM